MRDASVRDKEIGRIKRVGIVRVDVALTWHDGPGVSVDHKPLDGYYRFSAMGSLWLRSNSPDCYSAGWMLEEAWPLPAARPLVRLWRAWHLNDMQAGCAHQTRPDDMSMSDALAKVPPCPVTGYRFGSAWLVRVIPDDVVAEMREVIAGLAAIDA